MIELNVEDYCQNCGRFEAEITTMEKGYTWQEKSYDTITTCKIGRSVKKIMEWLKSEMK
nr:hypothetical protein [uncultured Anaerostipes sp.]